MESEDEFITILSSEGIGHQVHLERIKKCGYFGGFLNFKEGIKEIKTDVNNKHLAYILYHMKYGKLPFTVSFSEKIELQHVADSLNYEPLAKQHVKPEKLRVTLQFFTNGIWLSGAGIMCHDSEEEEYVHYALSKRFSSFYVNKVDNCIGKDFVKQLYVNRMYGRHEEVGKEHYRNFILKFGSHIDMYADRVVIRELSDRKDIDVLYTNTRPQERICWEARCKRVSLFDAVQENFKRDCRLVIINDFVEYYDPPSLL